MGELPLQLFMLKKSINVFFLPKILKKVLSWNFYRFQGYLEGGIFPPKESDKWSCI